VVAPDQTQPHSGDFSDELHDAAQYPIILLVSSPRQWTNHTRRIPRGRCPHRPSSEPHKKPRVWKFRRRSSNRAGTGPPTRTQALEPILIPEFSFGPFSLSFTQPPYRGSMQYELASGVQTLLQRIFIFLPLLSQSSPLPRRITSSTTLTS